MIKAIHFPIDLTGQELDDYLAKGWFRMGQTIFTTDFIPVEGRIHPVYWLRFAVQNIHYGKKQKRLIGINSDFSVSIKPFLLSEEMESLYRIYRAQVDFEAPPTVESYLLDGEINNIYDSQVIEIRDNGKLVAAGVFDQGETSMAGIMNFYHPDYKTRSPGKYLMLLKINHAIKTGKTYYYPGYIAAGFPKFDYKLFPDSTAAELYDTKTGEWLLFKQAVLTGPSSFDMDNEL